MANGIEEFDEARNQARVAAGFKGAPFFAEPNLAPAMNIGAGWPAETVQKLSYEETKVPTPIDPWNDRRANAS